MLPDRKLLALILISSLLTASCLKDAVKSLGELQALQSKLASKFGDEISVQLNQGANQGMLSVAFINSPLNDKTREERASRADETAQIVNAHYGDSTVVSTIFVIFLRRQTRFAVFHYTQSVDDYGFERQGQQLRRAGPVWPAPRPDREITAGYSGTEDATDISGNTFQLDGEPGGYGITVMPHFRLPGDARRLKSPPPALVSFLISSYSKKPRFGETVPFQFIADGSPVMQGTATFGGNDAQYCSLNVPYPVFRKLVSSREVAIKLGAKTYALTPEQIELLQKMDAYIQPGPELLR